MKKPLLILNVYSPCNNEKLNWIKSDLYPIIQKLSLSNLPLIILGDLNIDISKHNKYSKELSKILKEFELSPTSDESKKTWYSQNRYNSCSRIDYILLNNNLTDYLLTSGVTPLGDSDHAIIHAELYFRDNHISPYSSLYKKLTKNVLLEDEKLYYNFIFKQSLGSSNTINNFSSLKLAFGNSQKSLTSSNNKYIPVDELVRDLMIAKRDAYIFYLSQKTPENYSSFKKKSNHLKTYLRSKKQEKWKQFLNQIVQSNELFWKFKKSLNFSPPSFPNNLTYNNVTANTKDKILSLFQNYLADLFHREDTLPLSQSAIPMQISNDSWILLINKLTNKKSPGEDKIRNEQIKNLNDKNRLNCLNYFNHLISKNQLPRELLHANITLLHKKGPKDDPNNYRSISLLSCFGKVIEKFYTQKILKFCLKKKILSPYQFGFRPNHSTIDAVMSLKLIVENNFSKNKRVFAALLDLKKAFDSTDHFQTFEELFNLNIPDDLIAGLKLFYINPTASVASGSLRSDPFYPNVGVRQGGTSSPILFALYINELPKILEEANLGIKTGDLWTGIILFALMISFYLQTANQNSKK